MKRSTLLLGLPICLTILGCEKGTSIANPNTEVKELSAKVGRLENDVQALRERMDDAEIIRENNRIAYLTPGASGYDSVQFSLGTLTISLVDVKPYANGSKVTLTFGNPLAATIEGLKAKIEWGSVGVDGMPDNKTLKSRDVTFKEKIRPGSWTKADVVLEGLPPTTLGFVRVRDVGHQGILLNR
jgi:outer membrane murein-binding lipoprotein Lpp